MTLLPSLVPQSSNYNLQMFYVSRWKWWWSWWLHLYSLFIIFARLKTWHMDCRIKLNKLTNWIKVWKIEMTLTVQEQSRERGKKKEMMDGEFVRNDRWREKHDWKWMHHRQHPHPYCMKFLSKSVGSIKKYFSETLISKAIIMPLWVMFWCPNLKL